jgi:hypothetical protein
VSGRVNSITDDEPCVGCLRREAWEDCYRWLNPDATQEDVDEAFEQFLSEMGEDEPA